MFFACCVQPILDTIRTDFVVTSSDPVTTGGSRNRILHVVRKQGNTKPEGLITFIHLSPHFVFQFLHLICGGVGKVVE